MKCTAMDSTMVLNNTQPSVWFNQTKSNNNYYAVLIVDPAISDTWDYIPYDDGVKMDIFIKVKQLIL